MVDTTDITDRLLKNSDLTDDELKILIENNNNDDYLYSVADKVRQKFYGKDVYIRGLVEFTNICKNDCYYCGIRASNKNAHRYRLTPDEIFDCCENGYKLGFRTFVLQGGEDLYFTDDVMCNIISRIKSSFCDCAVTLSIGERSYESYKAMFNAGADRYLLRHETADNLHYHKLHPDILSPENRKQCLFNLKEIGYQVGSGFMVGSPYQTTTNLIADLRFLQKLKPAMIGIGPFITHSQTPFKDFKSGSFELTLKMISILRLMFPYALIPATTALGTINPTGREAGLKAGANVVMPNLSPTNVRKDYTLYNNKICTGEEAAECIKCLTARVRYAGYEIKVSRGDVYGYKKTSLI